MFSAVSQEATRARTCLYLYSKCNYTCSEDIWFCYRRGEENLRENHLMLLSEPLSQPLPSRTLAFLPTLPPWGDQGNKSQGSFKSGPPLKMSRIHSSLLPMPPGVMGSLLPFHSPCLLSVDSHIQPRHWTGPFFQSICIVRTTSVPRNARSTCSEGSEATRVRISEQASRCCPACPTSACTCSQQEVI